MRDEMKNSVWRRLVPVACLFLICAESACSSTSSPGGGTGTETTNQDGSKPAISSTDGNSTSVSSADMGKGIVGSHRCANCHQSSNSSDGILSGQTTPRPGTKAFGANLTPDKETGLGNWTDQQIIDAFRKGIDEEGTKLCNVMPHFLDIGDRDAKDVVAYLRSLPAVRREIPGSQCTD